MIDSSAEAVRPAADGAEGWTDAVTFSFGDADESIYGLVRLGLSPAEPAAASALAVVFSGDAPVAAVAERGEVESGAGWESLEVGGARATIEAPLERWSVGLAAGGAELRFTFTAD